MKWGELKRLVFFIISTIFIVPSMVATIQHRVIFSSENIVITQDTVNAIAFSNVKYAGLVNTGDVGSPSLPVKYLTFSVPYDAGIVCMEDILNKPTYQDGDVTSGINDDAGKLRAYLSYAFEAHALKYVLLGGKPPHVPIRYGYDNSRFGQIPTDLYFSEFNGDWDVGIGDVYGESLHDAVDYYPDVYIGRILCNTIEEANNYVEKLMLYELNPGNGNPEYLGRCLAIHSYEHRPSQTVDITSYFSGCDTIVQNGIFPNGAYVINQINSTHYGILFFNGHGNPGAITISETEDGRSVGVNAEDSVSCYLNAEDGNAFDCLTNKYTPSICFAMSCTNIPFDIYNEYDIKYNLGESFTLGNKYGGVAYVGHTRIVHTEEAVEIERLFAMNLKLGCNIGESVMNSKYHSSSERAHLLSYNLLGDPEMAVWTQKPDVYSDVEISVNRMDNSIYVTGCSIGDCVVSAYTPEGNVYKYEMENNGGVNMTISPNSAIMIYRQNMIPYFPPLLIQNQAYEESQYLFASSVKMGKSVDPERLIQGDVVFWNNIDFVIEATDDVYIGDGVIVYPGSTLTIKSKKAVTIDGALIKSGAKFIVEASEIRVRDSFDAENEAIIEFNPLKQ